jgi:hypothetical protein
MKQKIDYKDFGVTPALFLQWRSPRFGQTNPTRMNNQLWEWLIHAREWVHVAREMLNGPKY